MGVRLLAGTGCAAIVASLALTGAPAFASDTPAALPAPQGLTVTRAADDASTIVMSWQPVPGATFYRIDTVQGANETVTYVPAGTTTYTIPTTGSCVSYRMRVASENENGPGEYGEFVTAGTLAPGGIMAAVPGRDGTDGSIGTISWNPPVWSGESPLTGYRVQLIRYSDSVVLSDQVSAATSYRFPALDPARTYLVQVSPENQYGSCPAVLGKSLIDKYKPGDPTAAVATRRAGSTLVDVSWQAPVTGPAPDYYLITYGIDKPTAGSLKVKTPATSGTINLALGKNWVVEVRAYNANGSGVAPLTVTDPTAPVVPVPVVTPASPEKTPPTITATLLRPADHDGWHTGPVSVVFTCKDSQSGVAGCSSPVTMTTDGGNQVVTGTAVDRAGNTASTSIQVSLDRTAPAYTSTVDGTANAAGWYRTAPTINYTCTDATSGIADCPTPVTVITDGADQTVTRTLTDVAGNLTTTNDVVSLDRTAPTYTSTVDGTPNAAGWYRTAPTINYTCTDATSGIADCPTPVTVTTDGADQSITRTLTDVAGNTTATANEINLDRTAPTYTTTVDGTPNAAGWYRTAPTINYTCTDATSGIADCPTPVTVTTDGADQTVTRTLTDIAGNTATATVTGLKVDTVAPTTQILGLGRSSYTMTAMPTPSCTTTDGLSGVGKPAALTVARDSRGHYTATCAGATDAAGNVAAPVSVGYTVTANVPGLILLTLRYLITNNATIGVNLDLTTTLTRCQYGQFITKVQKEPKNTRPSLTVTQAEELAYWARLLS